MVKFKTKFTKIMFLVWLVAALWLVINIVSIIQENYRDSKSVLIPLNESEEVSTVDVSDYDDNDINTMLNE